MSNWKLATDNQVSVLGIEPNSNYAEYYNEKQFKWKIMLSQTDLNLFRIELLNDIEKLLGDKRHLSSTEWLRGFEVRKILKISSGTLQNLRISGKLKPVKINGIYLYERNDIDKLLKRE